MLREGPHPCPCCDYFVHDARGARAVCPVCYWEDDGHDLDRLDDLSDVNHLTLRRARANFERIGACDEAAVPLVTPPSERAGLRREVRATYH